VSHAGKALKIMLAIALKPSLPAGSLGSLKWWTKLDANRLSKGAMLAPPFLNSFTNLCTTVLCSCVYTGAHILKFQ